MTTILIIDDDEDMRQTLRLVLEKEGYRLLTASNGKEAEEVCRTDRPGLVITDIIMPDKDGLETITELRKSYPEVRIIAISGGGRRVNRDYLPTAQAFGADLVLYKPFRPQDVMDAIDEVSEKDRAANG